MKPNDTSNQPQGECPKCHDLNPYSNLACDGCGGRLPWADALDADRRERILAEDANRIERIFAEDAAESARQSAKSAAEKAARGRQKALRRAPRTDDSGGRTDVGSGCLWLLIGGNSNPWYEHVGRNPQARREDEYAAFWQGCCGGCFGVPLGFVAFGLIGYGWLFNVPDTRNLGVALLIAIYIFSRMGRRGW